MTPRSFWDILIKILGIYIILESLVAVPQFITTISFFSYRPPGSFSDNNATLTEWLYMIGVAVLYVQMFRYCVFKTDWIIDKLKLDQGFEDKRFEFNIHRSTVLKICIIVIGGLLLISNVPLFCKDVLAYFQQKNNYKGFTDSPLAKYILIYLIEIFIGYFMLTCSRMIVNFIDLQRRKSAAVDDGEASF